MDNLNYINDLMAGGRYTFTVQEMAKTLHLLLVAAQAGIQRLRKKRVIATLVHGFYLILPPEYRKAGCMPPEYFIHELMEYLAQPYYVGLLSAAQFHGSAHQQPQQFQVVINKTRLPLHCGQAHIIFVARKDVSQVPVQNFNTHYGIVQVSTPEATARDLVIYSHHCGGMDYVATVLSELFEKINADKLVSLIQQSREFTWVQRLGYLFNFLEHPQLSEALAKAMKGKRLQPCFLEPHAAHRKEKKDKKWNIWVNVELELEI